MQVFRKSVAVSVLVSAVCAIGFSASPQAAAQVAPAPAPSATLPEIFVPGARPAMSGDSQRGPANHYRVPAGYDADVALHPYTSGLGPCPQGAIPQQGCHHPTGDPIPPSHYERPPFTR